MSQSLDRLKALMQNGASSNIKEFAEMSESCLAQLSSFRTFVSNGNNHSFECTLTEMQENDQGVLAPTSARARLYLRTGNHVDFLSTFSKLQYLFAHAPFGNGTEALDNTMNPFFVSEKATPLAKPSILCADGSFSTEATDQTTKWFIKPTEQVKALIGYKKRDEFGNLQDPEVKEAWDAQVKLFSEKKTEIIKKRKDAISRKVSDNLTLAGCIDYVDFVQVTEQQANTISIDYLGEPMMLRRATEEEIADKSVDKIVLGYGYTLSGNEEAIRNFQESAVQAMNTAFQDITTDVQDNEKIEIKPIYHVETRQEGKFRAIASINQRSNFKS